MTEEQFRKQLKVWIHPRADGQPDFDDFCVMEIEAQDRRIAFLEAGIKICLQAFIEADHARREPNWFTKGESAAWRHAGEWLRKGIAAAEDLVPTAKS